jgi:hypothetical protein
MFLRLSGAKREPLSELPKGNRRVGGNMPGLERPAIHIQLENPGHHDDGLRTVSILEHCELQRFGPIDEEAPAQPLLILRYPMAVAVLSDAKKTRWRRGLR